MTNNGSWRDAQRDAQRMASGILLAAANDWNAALDGRTPHGMARSEVKTPEQREGILREIRRFFHGEWDRMLCDCCGIDARHMLGRLEDKYSASALRRDALKEGRAHA